MTTPEINSFKDSEQLITALTRLITTTLDRAITDKGYASLVVSGGSTPLPLFRALAQEPINWQAVTITLADERCVEATDQQSNALLVRNNLLQSYAKAAQFIPLVESIPFTDNDLNAINQQLLDLPTYDAVILGMGGDGHTASIFPLATNRDECLSADNTQAAEIVDPVTVTPLRVTQTADRLCNTKQLILHSVGEDKRELLSQIIANPDAQKWPISHFILNQTAPIKVYTDGPVEIVNTP